MNKIIHGDSLEVLKSIESESVDLLCSDPPYAISFMGKSWDKALPDIGIFKECFRVLKPGAFAFVMSAPRSDVCSRMAILLEDAGFRIDFTPIYWTYASGFPKAMNIGKMVDKRGGKNWHEQKQVALYIRERMKETGTTTKALNVAFETVAKANHWTALDANNFCMPTLADYQKLKPILQLDGRFDALIEREEAEREVIGKDSRHADPSKTTTNLGIGFGKWDITKAATPEAKALDGSYGGFQPKPAVEVVIVAMKPLSEKTYVDQALKNGKGITWLDDCRVPTSDDTSGHQVRKLTEIYGRYAGGVDTGGDMRGRFPANLLVENSVLDTITCTCATPEGDIQIVPQDLSADADGIEATILRAGQHPKNESAKSPKRSKESESPQSIAPHSPLHASLFTTNEEESPTEAQIETAHTESGCEPSESEMETSVYSVKQQKTSTLTTSNPTHATQNSFTKSVTGASCALHATGRPTPTASNQQYSRFFSLDEWAKTLPFLIVPKASKREKNEGLDEFQEETVGDGRPVAIDNAFQRGKTQRKNVHPTVKPLKLMSYLITLGSRQGDTVLDPFLGSGTTAIAAKQLGRECIGIEREKEYVEIAEARLNAVPDALL